MPPLKTQAVIVQSFASSVAVHHELFLTFFNNFVSAESSVALREAVGLPALGDRVQHGRDVLLGALGKLVVVVAVAAGGRRKHDVVADLAARATFRRVVVLKGNGYNEFQLLRTLLKVCVLKKSRFK